MTRSLFHRITVLGSLCCACESSEENDDTPADVEPLSPRDQLVADFWVAMHADDYTPSAELYERAGALLEESPDDGALHGYRASAGIWMLSEQGRGSLDPSQTPTVAFTSLESFEKAATLAANDGHWRGFHAATQFLIALQLGSDMGMSDALATYDQAYEEHPTFAPMVKVFTMVGLDGHHPIFPEAEQAVWDHFERCFGELDHADPVLSASAPESPQPLCVNSPLVPHMHEGMAILGGDILLRDGNVTGARRLLEGAKLSPTYDAWIGKPDVEARLGSLQERADLYADADQANDPPVGVTQRSCTGCHAD